MVGGACNDNMVKTAFVVAVTILYWPVLGIEPIILVNLAAVCFILPFLILATSAAKISRSESPRKILILLKFIELSLAVIVGVAIFFEIGSLLLLCIFGFGVQSALIGPLKYALLPLICQKKMLLTANAWMQAGTFIAILIGTLIGGDWIAKSPLALITITLSISFIGLLSVLRINLPLRKQSPAGSQTFFDLIMTQMRDRVAVSLMICISGFWGLGSVWLTHLPIIATDILNKGHDWVSWLLSLFVFGVALGAFFGVLAANYSIEKRVSTGAFLMLLGSTLLQFQSATELGLFITASGGGFLVLPLYTRLQQQSDLVDERIATNNVLNAMMIFIFAIASIIVLNQLRINLLTWLWLLSAIQFLLCIYHRRNLSLN